MYSEEERTKGDLDLVDGGVLIIGSNTSFDNFDNGGINFFSGGVLRIAAGESFDKVAKMLKLGYPGGPIIEEKARSGNASAHRFPRAFLENDSLDFSFSGLKTSVRNVVAKRDEGKGPILSDEDISASFQEAVVEILTAKLVLACKKEGLDRVVVTGGVASNGTLRERVTRESEKHRMKAYFPDPIFCTDNAAMIACAGFYKCQNNLPSLKNVLDMDASSMLKL